MRRIKQSVGLRSPFEKKLFYIFFHFFPSPSSDCRNNSTESAALRKLLSSGGNLLRLQHFWHSNYISNKSFAACFFALFYSEGNNNEFRFPFWHSLGLTDCQETLIEENIINSIMFNKKTFSITRMFVHSLIVNHKNETYILKIKTKLFWPKIYS